MPPHNSLPTVSITLYGLALFESTVLKDHVFGFKKKAPLKICDGDEMTARPLFLLFHTERKGRMGYRRLASGSFWGPAGGALPLYFVREVYSAVVCGQCV